MSEYAVKKGATFVLTRMGDGGGYYDTWTAAPNGCGFDDERDDLARQFHEGDLDPGAFELIEVQVVRRAVVSAGLEVRVRGDK